MKLVFNTSVISVKTLAVAVGTAIGLMSLANRQFLLGAILVIGACIIGSIVPRRMWLVRNQVESVRGQIQQTLQLSGIRHDVGGNHVTVASTGTRVLLRSYGPVTSVTFQVQDDECKKERFLVEVLTKYLRFIP